MRLFSFCILALFTLKGMCQEKITSFQPGELWTDNTGKNINAHGGGILFRNNKYYWFGEYKSDGTSVALTGVGCYSSRDLYNWKYEGIALKVEDDPNSDITSGCILERPKVIYNEKTKTYVMWFHVELKGKGYNAARVGIASSKKVTGPYTFIRSFRPNPDVYPLNMTDEEKQMNHPANLKSWTPEWLTAVKQGMYTLRDLQSGQMSRDMTLYVDDNGKAYHIYASEENLTLHIAELTDDYLGYNGKYVRVDPAGHNEAPALFKNNGRYYMITSGCTGWDPNAARLFTADNMMGPWTRHPNPFIGKDADKTFYSQSTFILPVHGRKNAFIYMGDRWHPKQHTDSRYVWLPVRFKAGMPYVSWIAHWDLKFFEAFTIDSLSHP